jgi:hypothetical protein
MTTDIDRNESQRRKTKFEANGTRHAFYSRPELYDRGWCESSVVELLGDPDLIDEYADEVDVAWYAHSGSYELLYAIPRVIESERANAKLLALAHIDEIVKNRWYTRPHQSDIDLAIKLVQPLPPSDRAELLFQLL